MSLVEHVDPRRAEAVDPAGPEHAGPEHAGAGPRAARRVGTGRAGPLRRRLRTVGGVLLTTLSAAVLLIALLAPNRPGDLGIRAFVRVPVEGLLVVALLLVLPRRSRRHVAAGFGALLGVLILVKALDLGFYSVLARPFDLVLDWPLLGNGRDYIVETQGETVGTVLPIVVALLAAAVPVLTALAGRRVARVFDGQPWSATRVVTLLGVGLSLCGVLGVQVGPGLPVASVSAVELVGERVTQVRAGLNDKEEFAEQAAVDRFADMPADRLLSGLRGSDVMFTFVESYGRDAIEDPQFAGPVGDVLADGERRLRAAGYSARSGFLTSSTIGGGSWLAHGTMLSGLWVDNQQRYDNLVASDRMTITSAFRKASWQTVGVMPAVTRAWPEAGFYGIDRVWDEEHLGYRGPKFGFAPMPDQYTLSQFHRNERAVPGHPPVMAELELISSHYPWAPLPTMVGWDEVGDGSVFAPMAAAGQDANAVLADRGRTRTEYRRSIEYTLNTLISYVEHFGGENLVLVFLGDHQPSPLVTGDDPSHDVPVTIVAHDPKVLDRIDGWGWDHGLKPGPKAPVWRMDAFRDRFLAAYSG